MECERCGCSEYDACFDDEVGPCGWSAERPGWCTFCAEEPSRMLVFFDRNDRDQIAVRRDFPAVGREAALVPLMLGQARITVGRMDDDYGFDEEYMYGSVGIALEALSLWDDPDAEPEKWIRHKPSNRRRANGDPRTEEVRP